LDGLIIEDDYDSELSYHNRPIPSLQGLDRADNVVYLGTFAKALSPTIRVGYMVLPSWIHSLYKDSYDAHFARVSLSTQLTLAHFMTEGHWERHISRIRMLNKKKHNAMKNALIKYLGSSCKIIAEGAGLAILIVPTKKDFDWKRLQTLAEDAHIKIYLAKERSGGDFEALRMGFGGFRLNEIDGVVEAFARVFLAV
ncbi:MAG TPA: PLP-dependent aminotransferase family protein, partial [Epsilonproteobacteria bacterium]|nr:PLP-dependent aminotransferase family protein [Campylobacterota bacterium]